MDSEAKFVKWMSGKFQQLGIDDVIFGNYVKDILKVDDSNENKIESLDEIFSELVKNAHEVSLEFVGKFNEIVLSNCPEMCLSHSKTIDKQLLDLLDKQKVQSVNEKAKHVTDEIRDLKNSILSMYIDVDDKCERCDSDNENGDAVNNGLQIEENRNLLNVKLKEQEKRQQSKLEAQKKKDKDKEDREKQKKVKVEKKEKRKTQKNERKR